jgi:quercetin dioxygenase-like cupin family protein
MTSSEHDPPRDDPGPSAPSSPVPPPHATTPPDARVPEGVRPVDLRDYVRFSAEAAVRVRVFASADLALDLWCVEPRQTTPALLYPGHDVAYTVLGGRSWFVTDEGELGLDPLGAMLVTAGTAHGIDNRAPDPLIVVAVAAPPTPGEPDEAVEPTGSAVRLDDDAPGLLRRALGGLFGSEPRSR